MGVVVSLLSLLHEILDADNLDLMRRFVSDHGFGDSSPRSSWHIAVSLEQASQPGSIQVPDRGGGAGRGRGEREKERKETMSPSDLKTSHRAPSQGPLPQGPHFSHGDHIFPTGTTSFPWGPFHITFGGTFNIQTIAIDFKPVLKLVCQNHLIGSLKPNFLLSPL